jgi:hypothetical protein
MRYWPVLMSLAFIVIILLIFTYTMDKVVVALDDCQKIGCEKGAKYAGSLDLDKSSYYECSCVYLKQIKKENLVCFDSDDEAISKGREKSYCGLLNKKK